MYPAKKLKPKTPYKRNANKYLFSKPDNSEEVIPNAVHRQITINHPTTELKPRGLAQNVEKKVNKLPPQNKLDLNLLNQIDRS